MFFFFKQTTAYEMRISDWSSDVCSSDLLTISFSLFYIGTPETSTPIFPFPAKNTANNKRLRRMQDKGNPLKLPFAQPQHAFEKLKQIGRASWRERGCQCV